METTIQDIQIFYGCSYPTARLRIKEIKQALKLPKTKKRICIYHIAKYEGLTNKEVKEIIKLSK